MPNPAGRSAMMANALRTSTMPSITVVKVPSCSTTVVPVYPAPARRSLRSVIYASVASRANQMLACAHLSACPAGSPVFCVS